MIEQPLFISAAGINANCSVKPDQIQVELCEAVLATIKKRVNINRRISSYKAKHIVERHISTYISNGALIQAAINQGFDLYISSPNAFFNISTKDWKTLKRSANY